MSASLARDLSRVVARSSVLRFVAVGVLSYVVDAGSLFVLHGLLGVPLLVATSAAFLLALGVNFGLNRTVVFGSGGRLPGQLVKYLALVGVNYLLTLGLVGGLVALGMYYLIAKTVATCVNAVLNYLAYRHWVFR